MVRLQLLNQFTLTQRCTVIGTSADGGVPKTANCGFTLKSPWVVVFNIPEFKGEHLADLPYEIWYTIQPFFSLAIFYQLFFGMEHHTSTMEWAQHQLYISKSLRKNFLLIEMTLCMHTIL